MILSLICCMILANASLSLCFRTGDPSHHSTCHGSIHILSLDTFQTTEKPSPIEGNLPLLKEIFPEYGIEWKTVIWRKKLFRKNSRHYRQMTSLSEWYILIFWWQKHQFFVCVHWECFGFVWSHFVMGTPQGSAPAWGPIPAWVCTHWLTFVVWHALTWLLAHIHHAVHTLPIVESVSNPGGTLNQRIMYEIFCWNMLRCDVRHNCYWILLIWNMTSDIIALKSCLEFIPKSMDSRRKI